MRHRDPHVQAIRDALTRTRRSDATVRHVNRRAVQIRAAAYDLLAGAR